MVGQNKNKKIEMDYYAYEYSVIQHLMNLFKIKNVEFDKNEEFLYGYERKKKIGSIINRDYIIFNFDNGFKFSLERKGIKETFKSNCSIKATVSAIEEVIEEAWIKEIKK